MNHVPPPSIKFNLHKPTEYGQLRPHAEGSVPVLQVLLAGGDPYVNGNHGRGFEFRFHHQ